MADQAVLALVVGHGDGAIAALHRIAARAAQHERREPAPVEQNHRLLVARRGTRRSPPPVCATAPRSFLVRWNSSRMSRISTSGSGRCSMRSASSISLYRALRGVVVGLERGRGRAQHRHGVAHLGAHHGHIAGVVARRFILLVGVVVLLIDHDQRQVGHRREHGRTRTYHNVGLAIADALPLLGALVVGERRVQDRDLVAENLVQVRGHRGSQSDLGHQQDRRASLGQHGLHGRQIHGGLARAGDAMQQHGQELPLIDCGVDLVERGLLRRIEQKLQLARFQSRHAEARGLSRNSTMPRRTSVCSVVRGTASSRSAATVRALLRLHAKVIDDASAGWR